MDFGYYGRDKLINHLEEVHGKECVSYIGTWTVLGVKNGLKDFGRTLRMDFTELNNLCKKIDEITEKAPSIKFKDLDKYYKDAEIALEEGNTNLYDKLKAKNKDFIELEKKYSEIFRLARKFEGCKRNCGIHASGLLVSSCDINGYIPTRNVNGQRVALFTGPQVESLNFIKLDILGLKTLDVLDKTIKAVNPKLTVNDLYKTIENNLDNKEMFEMIQNKETEGLFQIESGLFKSMMTDIMPTHLNDIIAITSLARPGPLSAGLHTAYGNRKNGFEESIPQLRGTENITGDSYNNIIYQEQLMLISKQVAGFNEAQTDSLCRKPIAKKKQALMDIFRKCLIFGKVNTEPPIDYNAEDLDQPFYDPKAKYGDEILGAINNGYEYEELAIFYDSLKGYSSYLFNKSHAAAYSVLTLCTMYCKKNYVSKFFAALLSMESQAEKVDLYSKTAKQLYGIKITTPDINLSNYDFTAIDNKILYGLNTIKGIGDNSIKEIIQNRPYTSIECAITKVSKKQMNKRILGALIKAGAFDFQSNNRYELLNNMMDIRKDKDDRLMTIMYIEEVCMALEKEILGTSITYTPIWDSMPIDTSLIQEFELVSITEKKDKKGNMMGFVNLMLQGIAIEGLVFASTYCKNIRSFDTNRISKIVLKGKKDSKGKFIVSSVVEAIENICYIDELDF